MRLTHLHLVQFRNIAAADLVFPGRLNLFTGSNGQGKTNLIEAIAYTSLLRSFRTTDRDAVIQEGRSFFHLQASFEDQDMPCELAIHQGDGGRTVRLDGKPLPSARRHHRQFPVVLLTPQDIDLASGVPATRREWFDRTLSLLKENYGDTLTRYQRALTQRNRELREGRDPSPWDEILAHSGVRLTNGRLSFLEAIRRHFQVGFERFFPEGRLRGDVRLMIRHLEERAVSPMAESEFIDNLHRHNDRDRATGQTHFGPHRDDFLFLMGSQPLKHYGSQGQTRLYIYALTWTLQAYLARELGRRPIALVDDIFSDLDGERTKLLFDGLREASQVFVASANENLVGQYLGDFHRHEVCQGQVSTAPRPEEMAISPEGL